MFRSLVETEKENARNSYGSFHSMHEIYGVLCEEVAEFFDEVRKKPDLRNPQDVLSELVQIASVAEIAAEDLELVDITVEQMASSKYETLKDAVREFVASMNRGSVVSLQKRDSCITSAFSFDEDKLNKVVELIND
jgi:NTP pyrophosphatase (non-canonical NTP hydrolase)